MKNFLLSIKENPLRLLGLLLGVLTTILSLYFSYQWLSDNGQNKIICLLSAIAFNGFIIFTFELSLMFLLKAKIEKVTGVSLTKDQLKYLSEKDKKAIKPRRKYKNLINLVPGMLLLTLSIFLSILNILSIIGALYNNVAIKAISESVPVVIKNDAGPLNKKIADYEVLLRQEQDLLKDTQDKLKQFKDIEMVSKYRATYVTLTNAQKTSANNIASYNNEIINLKNDISKISAANKSNTAVYHGNSFEYLSDQLKIDSFQLQFILTSYPSLFYDICSMFGIGYFLYGSRQLRSRQPKQLHS